MSDFNLYVGGNVPQPVLVYEGPLVIVENPRFSAFVPIVAFQTDGDFSTGPIPIDHHISTVAALLPPETPTTVL